MESKGHVVRDKEVNSFLLSEKTPRGWDRIPDLWGPSFDPVVSRR